MYRKVALALFLSSASSAVAQQGVPVTVDTFIRAETDMYMERTVKDGGLGKYVHNRTPTEIDKQTIIRMNRDTLYSGAVFELDAGPVTITLPDAGKRFMAMQVVNEDHYTPMVVYQSGPVTLTKENVGTRYAATLVRTLVDPNDPKDLDRVHALHEGLELHGASLPPSPGNPERHVEVPRASTRQLKLAGRLPARSHNGLDGPAEQV